VPRTPRFKRPFNTRTLATMTTYKLTYFGITGLGEPIRAAMALAGIPFEDEKVTGEQWGEKKKEPKFANCQLPVLEVTEGGSSQCLSQSRAILRYIGKIGAFNGNKLYPEDPMQQFYCDEVIELVEDFRPLMAPTFAIQDQAEKEKARAALVAPDGKMTAGMAKLNTRLAKFAFAAGENPSVADIYVVMVCYMLQAPTFLDGFPADSLKEHTNIVALKNKLCGLAPLQEYYKDANEHRSAFKV